MALDGGGVEVVDKFPNFGSLIEDSGRMDVYMNRRVATQASKAFGALRKSVFLDKNLSLTTTQKIYNACVLSILRYGAECWILLGKHEKKLNTFHHKCIRITLNISNLQQSSERITLRGVRRWGDKELAAEKVRNQRLEWLGHVVKMPDHRLPMSLVFWLVP